MQGQNYVTTLLDLLSELLCEKCNKIGVILQLGEVDFNVNTFFKIAGYCICSYITYLH